PYIADENGNRLGYEDTDDDTGIATFVNTYTLALTSHKGNVLSYTVSPTITEQGTYYVIVPENAFSIDGVDYNNELRHKFEIKDNHVEWSIPIYEQISTRDNVQGAQDHPQKGFSNITLTFPEDIEVKVNSKKQFTFVRVHEETSGSGTNQQVNEISETIPASETVMSVSAEANVVTLNFTPALTTDGVYKIVLPVGYIQMMGSFDEYVDVAGYIAYFSIKDTTAATITPQQNSTVTELSEVTFTFTKAAEVLADATPAAPAALYDADMNELEGYKLSVRVEGNKGIVSINPALDVDGKYTLIVPEGRFRCKASASSDEEPANEYRLTYTVVDPSDPTPSPAEGSVLPSISDVEFEFTKAVNVDLNPGANAYIKDAAGNKLDTYTVALSMDKDYESDVLVFAKVTPAITTTGTYSIVLEANAAACQRTWDSEARNNEEYVVTYEVKNPADSQLTPSSSTTRKLAKLSKLTITYPNAGSVALGTGSVKVLDADSNALSEYTATPKVTGANTAEITITPALTESATYKIQIEAGTFMCKLTEDGEATPSKVRNLTYIIKNPGEYTTTPAEGTKDLEEISGVTFKFASDVTPVANGSAGIKVVDAEGNDLLEDVNVTVRATGNQGRVAFSPAILQSGDIIVTIPDGVFSAKFTNDTETVDVKGCELHYNIAYRGTSDLDFGSDIEDIPNVVYSLYLSFGDATNVEIDDTVEEEITVTHDTSKKPAVAQRNYIARAAGDDSTITTHTATPTKVDGEDNKIKLTINPPITEAGETTLHIPAGKFIADGQSTQERTHVFAVAGDTSTWLNSVIGDEDTVTVITMNGVVILRDAPAADVRNLEPGLYIINCRSFLVRK
ncbi:MAG: hypothetical protein K2J15_00035, partial [Muribaculaceae bacterium]|nr:hypothetical protein [Muribaculaceae bacterium]